MGINGKPQPDKFRDLGGGKNIGGKGKGGGCFLVLLALAAPLLALAGGGWPV